MRRRGAPQLSAAAERRRCAPPLSAAAQRRERAGAPPPLALRIDLARVLVRCIASTPGRAKHDQRAVWRGLWAAVVVVPVLYR
jgi:hypothetical protein